MTESDPAATGTARLGAVVQFALLAGPLLSMLDASVVNVAIVPIAAELNAPLSVVQWVSSSYMLALGSGLALTPGLARRFGTLRVYTAGMAAFTLASVLCAAAPGIEILIGARVLQGLTGATLVPLAMSMLMGGSGTARRISPIAGMLLFLGPALGPSVGGLLIGAFGWRSIFLVNLPIGLLAVIASRRLPAQLAPPARRDERPDLVGAVLLATGLFALLLGINRGQNEGWTTPATWMSLLAALILLGAFWLVSRRAVHPALDLSIIRRRGIALSFLLCAAASIAAWSIVFIIPVFLQTAQGRTPFETGLALLPQGILTGLGTAFGQRAAGRIGVRWTVAAGFLLLVAASLGLLAIGADTPLWLTAAVLAARSASIGLVVTPLLSVVNEPLLPAEQADANTAFNIVQRVAGALGIGLIAGRFAASAVDVGEVAALHEIALVITALAAVAASATLLLPRSGAMRRSSA